MDNEVSILGRVLDSDHSNNTYPASKKMNDSLLVSKKEILFFHLTKKNDLSLSTKNIGSV